MKNPLSRALGVALLLCAAAAFAQPAATLAEIRKSGAIRMGFLADAAPFAFADRDKRAMGFSVDLCSRIAAGIGTELGATIAAIWVPIERAERVSAVRDGKADIECGITTSSLSRMKEVDFSLPIFIDGGTVLVRSGSGIARIADLAGKKIAVLSGTTTVARLREASVKRFLNLELVEVKRREDGFRQVRAGEVAGFAGDRVNLMVLALATGEAGQFALVDDDFSYEPYALVVRRNDADFRLAVNRVLAALYRSGEIVAIFDRTFGGAGKPSAMLQAMWLLSGLPE